MNEEIEIANYISPIYYSKEYEQDCIELARYLIDNKYFSKIEGCGVKSRQIYK